jgi:hypothetical protein
MTKANSKAASLNTRPVRCLAIVLAELQSGYGGDQDGNSSGGMRGGNRLPRRDGDSETVATITTRSCRNKLRILQPQEGATVSRKNVAN